MGRFSWLTSRASETFRTLSTLMSSGVFTVSAVDTRSAVRAVFTRWTAFTVTASYPGFAWRTLDTAWTFASRLPDEF